MQLHIANAVYLIYCFVFVLNNIGLKIITNGVELLHGRILSDVITFQYLYSRIIANLTNIPPQLTLFFV